MTRQKLSHRVRHVWPTRPRSSTTCSTSACASSWLSESPAWPAPTITTSTDSARDGPRAFRAVPPSSLGTVLPSCSVIGPPRDHGECADRDDKRLAFPGCSPVTLGYAQLRDHAAG